MENDVAKYLVPPLMVITVVGLAIFHAFDSRRRSAAEQKRSNAFLQLAPNLGLKYQMGKDTELPHRYFFVRRLAQGSNRYAVNSLSGNYDGHQICVFDYHYETTSVNSDETTHHQCSLLIIHVITGDTLAEFPEVIITREGAASSLSQALGSDDIDFESLEFSRIFRVQSKDRKFAYDVCHPRMMEYLMMNPDLTLEYNLYTIAMTFNHRLKPEQIRPNLDRLLAVRSLLPNYVLIPA
jgi:hypothetical protein